ncbi:MAG: site-2 protease family protein [Oscillospiraceae bacterium]|nr:site-2 protease family protein [Oscillospiraceae bacterium]
MNALTTIWNGLDWSVLTDILLSVIPALVCITLHELSHGFVAYKLGDNTAKNAGRLTLNPIRHIDVWGLVCMVLFKFGWAKPVPVNMRNFENPKRGMALTALAGPVCNFIIAIVFLFLYGLLWPLYLRGNAVMTAIVQMVLTTAYLSLALAIFNLLPIPPLDGSKVLYSFLNDSAYEKLMRYEKYGMIIMVVLVATGAVSGVLSTVTGWVYDKLFIFAEFGYNLVSR